jgi:hypothetical protein
MRIHDAAAGNASVSPERAPTSLWRESLRIAFWIFLGMAVFFLAIEHRVHLMSGAPWLPYLLLAACPLVHWLGHRGDNRHGGAASAAPGQPGVRSNPPVK